MSKKIKKKELTKFEKLTLKYMKLSLIVSVIGILTTLITNIIMITIMLKGG